MVSLGVWATRYREMQPISFGLGGGGKQANGTVKAGRREGAGPSYEMVPIKESEAEGDDVV